MICANLDLMIGDFYWYATGGLVLVLALILGGTLFALGRRDYKSAGIILFAGIAMWCARPVLVSTLFAWTPKEYGFQGDVHPASVENVRAGGCPVGEIEQKERDYRALRGPK